MGFLLIDNPEIEDFDAAIRDNGKLRQDFELTENVVGLETGTALVRSKKSGARCSYAIGNGTIFPADFIWDLEQGIFG